MSTQDIARRVSKLEQQSGGTIPPDQRDPELVQLLQQWGGEEFDINTVPFGISSFEFVKQFMERMKGKFRTLEPVKRPPGGWPKEE